MAETCHSSLGQVLDTEMNVALRWEYIMWRTHEFLARIALKFCLCYGLKCVFYCNINIGAMFKYMYENVENSMGETVVLMTFSANALHFIYFILSPLTDRDNSIALLARL